MAGQGNGSSETAGFTDIMLALAPMLAAASPRGGQNAIHAASLLARMNEARGERERDTASSAAMSRILSEMGLTTDPTLSGRDQASLATTQIAMGNAKRLADAEGRKTRDETRTRASLGDVAAVRGDVGTELPDDLLARLRRVPTVGTNEERLARGEALTDIRDSGKRLEHALSAAGRTAVPPGPGGYDPQEPLIADLPGFPGGAFRVGETGRVALPAMDMAEVPQNIFGMQRHIASTGEVPDAKTAERFSQMFNIPLPQLPGGAEARRAALKPPEDSFTNFAKRGGNLTPITMWTEPETGERKATVGETIPDVVDPPRPLRPPAAPTDTVSTRRTAARPIRDPEELVRLDQSLQTVVSDVTGRVPGFGQPGASTVEIPGVGRVPKTKVLEEAVRRRHGTAVTIRWDGKKFVIVRAWDPGQELETTTTRGPAPRADADEPDAEKD